MTARTLENASARAPFAHRARWRWQEFAFWFLAALSYFVFPDNHLLGAQVLIAGLFALSFDVLLGYAGIPSLGHAAFFGIGAYTAGLLAHHGWTEPLTALVAAAAVAAVAGLIASVLVVRLTGIALLMTTLGLGLLIYSAATQATGFTGGDDGLPVPAGRIFAVFAFDLYGNTAFLYSFVVAFLLYLLVRAIVNSPFGLELSGIRENARRMPALGTPVRLRYMTVFVISAAIAGVAGGLLAQTTQSVSTSVLGFDRSVSVFIMLLLGGLGSMIGAFIGAAVFMVAQDLLAAANPVYWNFWIGAMLVAVVLFARGGIMGGLAKVERLIRGSRGLP